MRRAAAVRAAVQPAKALTVHTVAVAVHAILVNVPVRERFVALEMSTNAMVVIIPDILRVLVVVVEALV